MLPRYIVLLLCLLGPLSYADSWNLPGTNAYLSDNDNSCFMVIPRGDTLDPSLWPESVLFEHPTVSVPHDSAYGILYKRGADSVYRPIWEAALNSDMCPVRARVHDEGRWAVTFDQWHFKGYGDNVVVVYDSSGSIVRSLSLSDMYSEERVASFTHTSSSIWWYCSAEFIEGTDELEIRSVSNGEMPYWSNGAVCEDYLRLSLSTGEVISFYSRFDEILATYPDSCYNTYTCPTVRYLYYLMNHPDSSIRVRCDSLDLSGNQIDSLRSVYDCFKYEEMYELGAAMQYLGRQVWFVDVNHGDEYQLLVETHGEIDDFSMQDSFPVVVMLSDTTYAIPLMPYESTFVDARLRGGQRMFHVGYTSGPPHCGVFVPSGSLSDFCESDSAISRPTNVYVHELDFGTRITIDLSKQLEWVRPEEDH